MSNGNMTGVGSLYGGTYGQAKQQGYSDTRKNFLALGGQQTGVGQALSSVGSAIGKGAAAAGKKDPGAFGQIAQGVAGIAGGLIGGGKRRREQRAAEQELKQRRQDYEQFEFKDQTRNMTNPFEDLTVNQQQAQFQSQQQQQALAGTLGGLQQAAGGSGIAALAQTLAQQSSANLQASAASIGQQEQANQLQRAQGQQNLEAARAEGAANLEAKEFGRTETLLGMAQARKNKADEARKAATQGLVGGIGNLAAGAGRLIAAGGA